METLALYLILFVLVVMVFFLETISTELMRIANYCWRDKDGNPPTCSGDTPPHGQKETGEAKASP